MKDANISWYIKEQDDTYVSHTEYYAGTCIPNKDFIIKAQLWNNRWNTLENVSDMINAKLVISFANIEDSTLLNICSVSINNGAFSSVKTEEFDRAIIDIGTIYGSKNNGSETNIDNYKDITIKFSDIQNNYRDGLKSMFLDVQYE